MGSVETDIHMGVARLLRGMCYAWLRIYRLCICMPIYINKSMTVYVYVYVEVSVEV